MKYLYSGFCWWWPWPGLPSTFVRKYSVLPSRLTYESLSNLYSYLLTSTGSLAPVPSAHGPLPVRSLSLFRAWKSATVAGFCVLSPGTGTTLSSDQAVLLSAWSFAFAASASAWVAKTSDLYSLSAFALSGRTPLYTVTNA